MANFKLDEESKRNELNKQIEHQRVQITEKEKAIK